MLNHGITIFSSLWSFFKLLVSGTMLSQKWALSGFHKTLQYIFSRYEFNKFINCQGRFLRRKKIETEVTESHHTVFSLLLAFFIFDKFISTILAWKYYLWFGRNTKIVDCKFRFVCVQMGLKTLENLFQPVASTASSPREQMSVYSSCGSVPGFSTYCYFRTWLAILLPRSLMLGR